MTALTDAQDALVTVNTAINEILSGKRRNRLEVGSGDFRRVFEYQQITLEELTRYRNELLQIIAALQEETPTFRTYATIPLVVSKGPY
jgi:hypothetical protein